MLKHSEVTFARCTVSTMITPHPAYIHGGVLLADLLGGSVSVYNGQDATSGEHIATFKGPKDRRWPPDTN